MRDMGFKYQVGEVVTHAGFLKPIRQPIVPHFRIIARTLVVGPGCTLRFYFVRPIVSESVSAGANRGTLHVLEESLAPLPEEEDERFAA